MKLQVRESPCLICSRWFGCLFYRMCDETPFSLWVVFVILQSLLPVVEFYMQAPRSFSHHHNAWPFVDHAFRYMFVCNTLYCTVNLLISPHTFRVLWSTLSDVIKPVMEILWNPNPNPPEFGDRDWFRDVIGHQKNSKRYHPNKNLVWILENMLYIHDTM